MLKTLVVAIFLIVFDWAASTSMIFIFPISVYLPFSMSSKISISGLTLVPLACYFNGLALYS